MQTKHILKLIAKKNLPDNYLNKKPQGFQINTNSWMHNFLKTDIIQILNSEIFEDLGIKKKYISKICLDFYGGKNSLIYEIWSLYCLGSWLLLDKGLKNKLI